MRPTTLFKKALSRIISRFGSASPMCGAINKYSLWLDQSNSLSSFFELNRKSDGAWGLKNAVFEKDEELLKLFMRYGENQRAQLLQDLAYLKFFKPSGPDGFFVEVGAGDGVHVSNTYFFEKEFGWHGLLVEPNPAFHASIRKHRTAHLETRAAFSSAADAAPFLAHGELSHLGGSNRPDGHVHAGQEIDVSTATLTRIFDDNDAPETINYMSIDTEGSELEILMGLDFDRYKIDFLTIEHNFVDEKRKRIREYMTSAGYAFSSSAASLWDDWYIRPA